jgi:hypothetical protein
MWNPFRRGLKKENEHSEILNVLCDYAAKPETPKIENLYRAYQAFAQKTDPRGRLELALAIARHVEEKRLSPDGLLPFIFADTDLSVISTAALEMAQNIPSSEVDPLAGPRYLYGLTANCLDSSRVGILMGLVTLGDRRVYEIIDNCWALLDKKQLKTFTEFHVSYVYAGYVEFLLRALETGSVAVCDWGTVLGVLYRLPLSSDRVIDVARNFQVNLAHEKQVRTLRSWTIAEFGATIWARLDRLHTLEEEPKLIPLVMKAWRIEHPEAPRAATLVNDFVAAREGTPGEPHRIA